ncbi:putative integral membrane protein [Rosellinia necatrix]|uniref:Putative integral membrane protein n=1 Tax=Rosellinia necatrix TaxID=77044 RepID=A0A1W2TCY7_ROSNE|nr:putative integral membrane protein [Rosellinia necatrix]
MATYSDTLASALPYNGPGKTDLVVETVFLALDFVFTGIRLWSRRISRTELQANDYLILTALFVLTARYAVVVVLVVECGLGLHAPEVERIGGPGRIVVFRKLTYVIDLMWLTLCALIKVSILHFYTVVFRTKWFRYLVYGVMALVIAFWIAAFFSDAFFCIPPQKSWIPEIPGHCGDSSTIYTVLASTDLSIDIIVIALPMPILWKLQLATAKKISLTFVFGLGFIIIIITSVRIRFFSELDPADITYTFSKIALLSSLVPLLGIINANLPISAPVFQKLFKISLLTTRIKRSNGTASSDNFQRLREDEYGLTDIKASRNINTIDDSRRINVQRDWEVNSMPVSDHQSNSAHSDSHVL